jgi:DNA-binding transcriptional LysR family regulator
MDLPDYDGLSFTNLRSLIEVHDAGSIAAAAARRRRSPDRISKQIKALERYFGCTLTIRVGKKGRLTSQGEELVRIMRPQLKALEGFVERVREGLGQITIAAGDSIIHLLLAPIIRELQEDPRFKNTVLNLVDPSRLELFQSVSDLKVDIGIFRQDPGNEPVPRSLEYKTIIEYSYKVFTRSRNPDGKTQFSDDAPLACKMYHWGVDFTRLASAANAQMHVKVWCANFAQVYRLVQMGDYAGILPDFAMIGLDSDNYVATQPAFLKEYKGEILMVWNPALMRIRQTSIPIMRDFLIEKIVSIATRKRKCAADLKVSKSK